MPTVPKSDAEHARDGTWRKDHHGNRIDLEVPEGRPTAPGSLNTRERKHWQRLLTALEGTNALSPLDGDAIYQTAVLAAQVDDVRVFIARADREIREILRRIRAAILEDPTAETLETIRDLKATLREHEDRQTVLSSRLRTLQTSLRGFLDALGLTPSGRGRIKVHKVKAKTLSPVEAFRRRLAGKPASGE